MTRADLLIVPIAMVCLTVLLSVAMIAPEQVAAAPAPAGRGGAGGAGAAGGGAGGTGGESAGQVVQWQHLAMAQKVGDKQSALEGGAQINKLGREGWELVDVEAFTKEGTTSQLVYYFKKRK
jgi:hypothetical protein